MNTSGSEAIKNNYERVDPPAGEHSGEICNTLPYGGLYPDEADSDFYENAPVHTSQAQENGDEDNICVDEETTSRILREIFDLTTAAPPSYDPSPPSLYAHAQPRGYSLQYNDYEADVWSDPGVTPPPEHSTIGDNVAANNSDCLSAFKMLAEATRDTYDTVSDIHAVVMRAEYSHSDNASLLSSIVRRLDAIEQRQDILLSTLNGVKAYVEALAYASKYVRAQWETRPWDGSPQ